MRDVDIIPLLDDWPFDPEDSVRIVRASDGRQLLQVRLPMGIEQYELDGRPDGKRPFGSESLLAYHEARLADRKAAGTEDAFRLSHEECTALFEEGVLYYYRYFHLFQAQEWERTIRDTTRNLRLFDLVNRYAAQPEDRSYLEQWRPYIIKFNAMASALLVLKDNQYERALRILQAAERKIESLPEIDNPTFGFERERAMDTLRQLGKQVKESKPLSPVEKLEHELQKAVAAEAFEHAAKVRDRLEALRKKSAP